MVLYESIILVRAEGMRLRANDVAMILGIIYLSLGSLLILPERVVLRF